MSAYRTAVNFSRSFRVALATDALAGHDTPERLLDDGDGIFHLEGRPSMPLTLRHTSIHLLRIHTFHTLAKRLLSDVPLNAEVLAVAILHRR